MEFTPENLLPLLATIHLGLLLISFIPFITLITSKGEARIKAIMAYRDFNGLLLMASIARLVLGYNSAWQIALEITLVIFCTAAILRLRLDQLSHISFQTERDI